VLVTVLEGIMEGRGDQGSLKDGYWMMSSSGQWRISTVEEDFNR